MVYAPTLAECLVSGILTGSSFILAHAGLIPPDVEIALFAIAIRSVRIIGPGRY